MHRSAGSFELLLGPLLFGVLGLWLDARAGTRPVITVSLVVFAVVGAFCKQYYSYRHAMMQAAAERDHLARQRAELRQMTDDAVGHRTEAVS